jgi:hypothetical protein
MISNMLNTFWGGDDHLPKKEITLARINSDTSVKDVDLTYCDTDDIIGDCARSLNSSNDGITTTREPNRGLLCFHRKDKTGLEHNLVASTLMKKSIWGPVFLCKEKSNGVYASFCGKEVDILMGLWRMQPTPTGSVSVELTTTTTTTTVATPTPTPTPSPALLAVYESKPSLKPVIEKVYDQILKEEEEKTPDPEPEPVRKTVPKRKKRIADIDPGNIIGDDTKRSSRLRRKG